MKKLRFSFVIPYHKDEDMLRFCIKTINQTVFYDKQIVVIGNNINKNELDFSLEDLGCEYYKYYENLQYPKAVNIGVSKCENEIIIICDPDVFFWDNWIDPMYECLIKKENIGAVSAKLINPLNNRILDFGMYYTKYNAAHSTMGLKYDHPLSMFDRKVQTACSAVLMTKKSVYLEIGGMDEELPFSYTECDYALRLAEHGYETWVSSKSLAYHKGSTDPNNSKFYAFRYYNADAKGIFYAKNYHRINFDVNDWFIVSSDYAKKQYNLEKEYILLDFTSIYDKNEYYKIITQNLNIQLLDVYPFTVSSRNIKSMPLYKFISFNFIDMVTPILYFVDTFVGMFDNELWFKMRDISRDLVVDRHGNIIPLKEIALRKC